MLDIVVARANAENKYGLKTDTQRLIVNAYLNGVRAANEAANGDINSQKAINAKQKKELLECYRIITGLNQTINGCTDNMGSNNAASIR